MRALATELNESSNAVRVELNRLTEASMLSSVKEGNKLLYQVNDKHPLYESINTIIKQYVGVDEIISNVIKGLGKIEKLYLTGSLAKGLSTDIIDIVMVGDLNQEYLLSKIAKIENGIGKKIRYIVYSGAEAKKKNFGSSEYLLIYAP